MGALFLQLLLNCVNANLFAIFANTLELNLTVDKSEECVVRTSANVVAGVNVCSALFNKNVTCKNKLTVGSLRAKAFGFGITAVFSGAHTFFMGEELHTKSKHVIIPP